MDPTKPILDLYSDSYYNNREREVKPQSYKSSNVSPYNQNSASKYNSVNANQNQYSKKVAAQANYGYGELQDKYQDLYQAYKDKTSKLSVFQSEADQLKNQNTRLRDEIDRLTNKNEELNSALLSKNMELEDAYRRLQEEMRGGSAGRTRVNDGAIDKLEDGLREAINSNFQILRQSALAQLKQYIAY